MPGGEQMQPLSPEEQEKRRPLPPEMLVGALQDPIHRDVGRSRPAKVTRVKPNIAPKQTKDCSIGE